MKRFQTMFVNNAEIELTSYCNTACPGCLRTQMLQENHSFPINHLNEENLFQKFQQLQLEGFIIDFYGVLGDPLMHPNILKIIKWFLDQGCELSISTNASLRSEAFYFELGQLSFQSQRLFLMFAVDGLKDTNPIYRVNTKFSLIKRNMKAYSKARGRGAWVFIEFDHNFHQKNLAREQVYSLNLDFRVSRAIRNEVYLWPKEKTEDSNKKEFITHRKGKPHPKINFYKKMISKSQWNPSSINCVYAHKNRFFLSSDGRVWPCCYLWDEYISQRTDFYKRVNEDFPDKDWNSIYKNDFDSIFHSDFYKNISELWEEKHKRFTKRCYASCGAKGALRTQLSTN